MSQSRLELTWGETRHHLAHFGAFQLDERAFLLATGGGQFDFWTRVGTGIGQLWLGQGRILFRAWLRR